MKSCWEILAITETTDLKAIKKAYSKMVRQYHPEDDPEMYQTIRQAYESALKIAKQSAMSQSAESNNQAEHEDMHSIYERLFAFEKEEVHANDDEEAYKDVFDVLQDIQNNFVEKWKQLYETQATYNEWEQFFQEYKGFEDYLFEALEELIPYHKDNCVFSCDTALLLRLRLSLYQFKRIETSVPIEAFDEQLKRQTMMELKTPTAVLLSIKEKYFYALLHIVLMDWAALDQSPLRTQPSSWQAFFKTVSFQLVKQEVKFHELLWKTLDRPKPLQSEVQQMMQEQLSLPKESEVLAHISGKCFDIVDFSDLMSKQRPVEDTVLEQWIMLSESTKRNDTAVWITFLSTNAFLEARTNGQFLKRLSEYILPKKRYRQSIKDLMDRQLKLSSYLLSIQNKAAQGIPPEQDVKKAVFQLHQYLSKSKKAQTPSKLPYIIAVAVLFSIMTAMNYQAKEEKDRMKEYSNIVHSSFDENIYDLGFTIYVEEKEGKKILMQDDEELLEVKDYRNNKSNYRIVKLKDGWHFYDLAYRQVMDEVYDDILVVKGKDGESEYYAACLHGKCALYDEQLIRVEDYKYMKEDFQGKYYADGKLHDKK